MLKINTKVLTSDGRDISTGTLVKVIPDYMAATATKNELGLITGYNVPVYLPMYFNQDAIDKNYKPLEVVGDEARKNVIYQINVSVTNTQFNNQSKTAIEGKAKAELVKIYEDNIEII